MQPRDVIADPMPTEEQQAVLQAEANPWTGQAVFSRVPVYEIQWDFETTVVPPGEWESFVIGEPPA